MNFGFALSKDFPYPRFLGFFGMLFFMFFSRSIIEEYFIDVLFDGAPYYAFIDNDGNILIKITELSFWILVLIVYVAVLVYLFIIPLTLHFRPDSFLSHLFIKDEKAESKKDEKAESKSFPIEKQIDGTTVILLYILSFFIPLAGFIVGAIYASKKEEHYKHVGKNCLIFSVLNIVLSFIMIAVILGSV